MSWSSTPPRRIAALAALAAMLVAGGCTTKKADTANAGSSGKLATGPGVTDQAIKLGVLSDRTGPFAAAGKGIEQGRLLFWDERNAQGGVCGRKVEFVVKDHGYNTQNAVTAYAQLKTGVLALDELLGSPVIAALQPNVESDKMLTLAASWSSSLLGNPYVVITGTTYDVEMINGVDWLSRNKGLSKGDKIGHIFLEGDFGENAVAGSRAATKELGLQLVEHKIKPTDADLTAQVTALRAAGAKAVLLTTTPPQTASAVAVAEASGFDATFLASFPSFSPALLKSPARAALEKKLLLATSIAPVSATSAGPAAVRTALAARYPDQPKTSFVIYGYAQGQIMAKVLDAACKNGALTRDGLLTAFQSLADVQTDGLVAPLNYSKPGQIPARQTYILRPDAGAVGGLSQVQDLFESTLATSYQPTS